MQGCGGGPGRAGPSRAELPRSGPRGQASAAAIMGWQAASIMGWRALLWGGEGRAATIMGWRGLPRPEGGRWVAGHIMGWRALVPPGGVLWDEEDAPQGAGGGGGGKRAAIMGWQGPPQLA